MNAETRYLAFQIFTYGPNPKIASMGEGTNAVARFPDKATLREGDEALRAYRKFLQGDLLIEAKTEASTLLERLPPKIQKIQKELPAWIQKAGNTDQASALMQKPKEHLHARNFEEAEKTADSILKMMSEKP